MLPGCSATDHSLLRLLIRGLPITSHASAPMVPTPEDTRGYQSLQEWFTGRYRRTGGLNIPCTSSYASVTIHSAPAASNTSKVCPVYPHSVSSVRSLVVCLTRSAVDLTKVSQAGYDVMPNNTARFHAYPESGQQAPAEHGWWTSRPGGP